MAVVSVRTRNVPSVAHIHTGGDIRTGRGMKFLYVMCIVTMVTWKVVSHCRCCLQCNNGPARVSKDGYWCLLRRTTTEYPV